MAKKQKKAVAAEPIPVIESTVVTAAEPTPAEIPTVQIPPTVETPAATATPAESAAVAKNKARHQIYLQARAAKLPVLQAAQVSYAFAAKESVSIPDLITRVPSVPAELWAQATPKKADPAIVTALLQTESAS